jgi:multidrug efflux pump subunit AcrA (membrane-fusion protein)
MAPFDVLIISGDLNQSLGSSVAQGDLLFVIAPLDDYRIILQVNERYIQQMQKGQQGTLVLSSLPDEKLALAIERITPISTAEEGENYFRVEAVLDQNVVQLRPGMEGVAKIEIGERSLAWIWSHEIIDWLQLWFWRWLP